MNNNVAEIQVSYSPQKILDFKVVDSKKSFELMLQKWEQGRIEMQEEVKLLLLNRNNKVLGIYSLATGGITSCVVDVRIILAVALKALATGIILVHNHPSGNLAPSVDDKKITEQLNLSCKLIGITLVDHLIITRDDYFSFADEGLL
ncbi:JAB domain-containing protein [Kaistella sp. PBT33-4]|uniref:JAB domain-containing protein n=1 Tax=Kaistella sp. PBT33-4 TaxID=3032000 RepID=UPI0023D7C6C3|nr:JAB domain-containing protein [Kaistella sp. PBT33-4]MDF0719977.1 JAB domain-containing protein [Kaistella sp. PBT33-4]